MRASGRNRSDATAVASRARTVRFVNAFVATARFRPLRLGIDLDGCVYDFVDSLRRTVAARTATAPSALTDACCWNFYSHCWGMTLEDFLEHFTAGVNSGVIFATGQPEPDAVAVLAQLRRAGHTLHVVTDRASVGAPGVAQSATATWLRANGIAVDSLTFSADKASVPTDLFIDDRSENYLALQGSGTQPVLFDRPWNQDVTGALRVRGWQEFGQLVSQVAAA